ncbi:MAG: asparagine synthase (glutamine-hydrolyzing) [Bacteroidetes bacterium RIFCSPLOWO2_12_FULL_35_15]|nr:MAG: asparagine synthase (glutamine-hydrolyzing) [Bacteroidetes bacterium RIFCSPLOWO2_12_FULL_35_15]
MCGINGIVGFNDLILAKQKIIAMNNRMRHRGPDDEGVFVADKIALGHRRLSIIDLSAAGHQPMQSHDGRYQIVYNGEIYNYKELKFELQRVVSGSNQQTYFFQTNTDTEVIIAAYARWGSDCVNHFNGMFAFAIWDDQTKELFIARDRLGIKPLYYCFTDGVFAFSSELRSLLACELIPKKIDEDSLIDYLRYQTVHAPNTIVKGIKMLMPGHFIEMKNEQLTIKNYWSLTKNISNESNDKSYNDVCKDVNQLLTKSVERRLIADVPFGAFLSGGIDSSAIVGLMSKVSTEKVKTFSVTFDEREFSEAKYAQLIAKKFNTDHHEIKLKPSDFIEQLPNALKAMDHPSGDGPNTFIVSKATKEAGITMALSGLGGDELFAGYDVFKKSLELNKKAWLNLIPQFMRGAGASILLKAKPGVSSEKIAELLKQNKINFNSFYPITRQVLMDKQILEIVNGETLVANKVSEIISEIQPISNIQQLTSVSIAEISTYMQNVLLRDADQMSMAHALEVRVPFLDHTLVEYVLGVPDNYKSTVSPKKLLVDALGELLPSEIVNRPKMGFTFPWKNWMKNELKIVCEQKIVSLSKRKLFNEQGVTNLWNSFLKDDPRITWSRIWYLVVLENWMQENGIEN